MAKRRPRSIVIAGLNGAGRPPSRELLPKDAGIPHFVNADLIAAGLSPLDPSAAQVAAARILLEELDRLNAAKADFAFETTLSGRAYGVRIRTWRKAGYGVEIAFLKLPSVDLALNVSLTGLGRVVITSPMPTCAGVSSGVGVISRRSIGVAWMDGPYTTTPLRYLDWSNVPMAEPLPKVSSKEHYEFVAAVGRALKRAVKVARKTARMHGTPIAIRKDGKVVLEKP